MRTKFQLNWYWMINFYNAFPNNRFRTLSRQIEQFTATERFIHTQPVFLPFSIRLLYEMYPWIVNSFARLFVRLVMTMCILFCHWQFDDSPCSAAHVHTIYDGKGCQSQMYHFAYLPKSSLQQTFQNAGICSIARSGLFPTLTHINVFFFDGENCYYGLPEIYARTHIWRHDDINRLSRTGGNCHSYTKREKKNMNMFVQ